VDTSIIVGAATALTGAIVFLFKLFITENKANQESMLDLSVQIGEMKGREAGITHLSAEVLETVHNALTRTDPLIKPEDNHGKATDRPDPLH
jgi:hypothetical protein